MIAHLPPLSTVRTSMKRAHSLAILSSALFDPLWKLNDEHLRKYPEFAGQWLLHDLHAAFDVDLLNATAHERGAWRSVEDVLQQFRGAYLHHWHNRFTRPIHENSFMDLWIKRINRFLNGEEKSPINQLSLTKIIGIKSNLLNLK